MEKQRNLQNLLKDKNGGGQTNAAIQASNMAINNKFVGNQRQNFFNNLKNMKNKRNAMSIENVKSTFVATELIPDSKQKPTTNEDGLLEDRDSDSEFDPENQEQEKVNAQVWDDEENIVQPGEPGENADEPDEEGEEESEIKSVAEMSNANSQV